MNVALFVPCYVDQLYPQVAIASLHLLEKLGCTVHVPLNQTCCGQPMANGGSERDSLGAMHHFVDVFHRYDHIVTPSGSCALHVKEHYDALGQRVDVSHVRARTYELSQFLTDVLKVTSLPAAFPQKVGLHASCHGLRGLRLGCSSELHSPPYDNVRKLLELVDGLEVVDLTRPDECCGFGGTFAVSEEAVSVRMGMDRLQDHLEHGVDVITGTDMSCLMHLEGLARRKQLPVRVMHLAEILNGGSA